MSAVYAAFGGLVAMTAIIVLVWVVGQDSDWGSASTLAVTSWLLAHGVTWRMDPAYTQQTQTASADGTTISGSIGLMPLLLTALLGIWIASRSRRMVFAQFVGRRRVQLKELVRPSILCLIGFVATYAIVAASTTALAGSSRGGPVMWQVVVCSAVMAASWGAIGVISAIARITSPDRAKPWGDTVISLIQLRRPIDHFWWDHLVLALRAVGWAWLAGAITAIVAVVLRFNSVASVHDQIAESGWATVGLVLLHIVYLPVAALWGMSWLTGAGFSVGEGTYVRPAGTSLELLPAIPGLGALPANGANPWWFWLVISIPVICGVWAGNELIACYGLQSAKQCALSAIAVAAGATMTGMLLTTLATGGIGPGRLEHVGPHWWLIGPLLGVEIGFGVALAFIVAYVDQRPDT